MSLRLGDALPHAALPDTDGREHELDAPGAAATVVVFTCNHCPYALAWHDRLAAVARDYRDRGVRAFAVNSNDAERYPRDSLPAMQERVRADGGWPLPYLHDAGQDVARLFGARVTPDVFVFAGDGRLVYRGAPDADSGDPSLDARWLRDALDDALAGRPVARPATEPVGCSLKWKAG
ncbi:MAG TPA: thioredoxin family protein [Solirubrobacteraceae bacterium]|nr:thioredoxin family protein [Solirubrobacteraceae bacterium]